jgi:hypothetical protein
MIPSHRNNNNNKNNKKNNKTALLLLLIALVVVVFVVVVLPLLRLSTTITEYPACFEVNEWVFDRQTQRCLVRFRRTRVSSGSGAIVSGTSLAEMESRAQCSFNGFSRLIEDDCWKQGSRNDDDDVFNQWIPTWGRQP